ncbi:PAS domain S-box protein [Bacillaceae bacterium]
MPKQGKNLERRVIELETLFQHFPHIVVLFSPQFLLLDLNEKGEQWLGAPRERLFGKALPEVFKELSPSIEPCIGEAIEKKTPVSAAHEMKTPEGIDFFEAIYSPVVDRQGEVTHVVSVYRKISADEYTRSLFKNVLNEEHLPAVRKWQHAFFKLRKRENGDVIYTFSEGIIAEVLQMTTMQVYGKTAKELFPPLLAKMLEKQFHKAFQGKNVYFEYAYSGLSFNTVLYPVERNGAVTEVLGLVSDITKRKKIERELQESEERYSRLVERLPVAIVVYDYEGVVLYTNQSGVKLFGATHREELVGKLVFDHVSPKNDDGLPFRMKRTEEERLTDSREERLLRLDGQYIDVEVTDIPLTYMGKPVILAVIKDITRRKQMEEALRRSEAKYRLIAENMTDLIGVLDRNGIVQYASPSHEAVLGFPPEAYEGCSAFARVHPEDVTRIKKKYAELIAKKIPFRAEFRHQHKNGYWVTVEASGMPVIDQEGKVESVVVVARDITERKQTEELLRKSQFLSVLGELAAGVAHEIRNPLTSIKGFLRLMQQMQRVDDRYLSIIESEVEQIEAIVNEFLMVAKPHGAKWEKKNLPTLLENVIAAFRDRMEKTNTRIVTEFDRDIPHIMCEEQQLQQAFKNILENAFDAMPGGGTIKILAKRYGKKKVLIRVVDEGSGIPEENIAKLGAPHYKIKERGTGLGLMVSFKIIEIYRGKINIHSELGKGTTVEVILPVS